MKNTLKNFIFRLEDFHAESTEIINKHISLIKEDNNSIHEKYKIINYLGSGTVGQVYLLEPENINNDKKFVIKISNSKHQYDLKNEVQTIENYFKEFNINHCSYPIYWGFFNNVDAIGVIYPYLGFYNLEKLKRLKYKISFKNNLSIIKQIISQLISLKDIIHGDLKPPNVVIDFNDDKIIASIVDFGLIKKKTSTENIISTNYITSPESLLTLDNYYNCLVNGEIIDFTKHDYYGLYAIVLNLFLQNGFWYTMKSYMVEQVNLNSKHVIKHEAIDIFGYTYYRLFYNNHQELPNNSYRKLIYKIEMTYPTISNKKFLDFDNFFKLYIAPNLDYSFFNVDKAFDFKDFLIKICHFDPTKRLELEQLLEHPFLN